MEGLLASGISQPAVYLLVLASLLILMIRNWRWIVLALFIQYLGMFVLIALSWSVEMAAAKAISGWMAGAILGVAMSNAPGSWQESGRSWLAGYLFRLTAAGLVILAVVSISPQISTWLRGVNLYICWGSLILIGMGLLHLGLTDHPFRVIVGLLTILSGFEIIYAALESSVLVTALLAAVDLGLALAGAYLVYAPTLEEAR